MCVLLGKLQVSFHLSLTCVGKGIGITCHGLMQFSGDCRMETNVDLAGFMTPWKLYNNLKLDPITVVGCIGLAAHLCSTKVLNYF